MWWMNVCFFSWDGRSRVILFISLSFARRIFETRLQLKADLNYESLHECHNIRIERCFTVLIHLNSLEFELHSTCYILV